MLNGQTPLLLEDKQFTISSSLYQPQEPPPTNAAGPASVRIQASDGSDITSQTTGAQLGALLHLRNQILPSLIGDAYQAGDLNDMAKQFADRVNQLLTSGNITDGPPAQPGVPLFTYNTSRRHGDGRLAFGGSQRHAGPAGNHQLRARPTVSNGVPLALSALASPVQDADKVNGLSYSQFYGQIAGSVGHRPERRHQQPGRATIAPLAGQGPAPAVSRSIARRRSHHPHAVPARLPGHIQIPHRAGPTHAKWPSTSSDKVLI